MVRCSLQNNICCPNGKIFGVDLDLAFAYPTVKYVKIQDARLGLLKVSAPSRIHMGISTATAKSWRFSRERTLTAFDARRHRSPC